MNLQAQMANNVVLPFKEEIATISNSYKELKN